MTPSSGVYQIRNRTNGKRYIGSAVNLRKRWQYHLGDLCRGRHCNRHLQAAFDKYGESAFAFSILEPVGDASQLIPREQHFLDTLGPEYNIAPMAGSQLGFRHTDEARSNMSIAKSGLRHPNYGKHLSAEHRAKMSEAHKGKHMNAESRRKMSEAKKGERHPNYGKPRSEETRRKISKAKRGKQPSAQHRARLSEAGKAYWRRIHSE